MKKLLSGRTASLCLIPTAVFGFGLPAPPLNADPPGVAATQGQRDTIQWPATQPAVSNDTKQAIVQVRALNQACILYAQSNNTYYPDSDASGKPRFTRQAEIFDVLSAENYFTPGYAVHPRSHIEVPDYVLRPNKDSREARLDWIDKNSGFVFVPGLKDDTDEKRVADFEKAQYSDGRGLVVVYEDNHVEVVPMAQAKELIQQQTGKSLEDWSGGEVPDPKAVERAAATRPSRPEPNRRGHFQPVNVYFYDMGSTAADPMDRLFIGKSNQLPPIPAPSGKIINGQPAGVRAWVFACGDRDDKSKRFIGYLETYTKEAKDMIEKASKAPPAGGFTPEFMQAIMDGHRISTPGSDKWVPMMGQEGYKIQQAIQTRCPDPDKRPVVCNPPAE